MEIKHGFGEVLISSLRCVRAGMVLSKVLLLRLILVLSIRRAAMDCHKSLPWHVSRSMQGSGQEINELSWATPSVQISGV